MLYYKSAFPSKFLRKSVQEFPIGTVGGVLGGFFFLSPLDPCMSRSSPMLSSQISVTGAQTLCVISAVQGRDSHSESNLYKIAGLCTVCHFYRGHANDKALKSRLYYIT